MTKAKAKTLAMRLLDLQQGKIATWGDIEELEESRQFWWPADANAGVCTCTAFRRDWHCFHVLALGMQMGKIEPPTSASAVPVSVTRRGAPRRAGNRGATPPAPDARDARIAQLEAQLAAARATAAALQQPLPKRRRQR